MDPALHELFQTFGFLIGTAWLYRFIRIKHEAWTKELRAFRSSELSGNANTDPDVKVVTDPRLGRLGIMSIWCDHPGARCSCMQCRWNRKYGAVPPPPPVFSTGPGPTEPLVPPPPPTHGYERPAPTAMPGEPERRS